MGCFSFYPTKNLGGMGDGGLITTDNTELAERLRILRDHGQHPRYYHHEVGINSRLDALQAAVLSVKLARLDSCAAGRQNNANTYAREFARTGLDAKDWNSHSETGVRERVEPIHDPRSRWRAGQLAAASLREKNRFGRVLSRAAASAKVFCILGASGRQLAGDGTRLP